MWLLNEKILWLTVLFVWLSLLNDSHYFLYQTQLKADAHSIHPLKLHPSLLFTDSSFLGFKIVCSNLAVTAMRLVEDWETNTRCHLSACLSVCLSASPDCEVPHKWQVSVQQCASSADLNQAVVSCVRETKNVQALQVCVCIYGCDNLCPCLSGMCVCICPADWV